MMQNIYIFCFGQVTLNRESIKERFSLEVIKNNFLMKTDFLVEHFRNKKLRFFVSSAVSFLAKIPD